MNFNSETQKYTLWMYSNHKQLVRLKFEVFHGEMRFFDFWFICLLYEDTILHSFKLN